MIHLYASKKKLQFFIFFLYFFIQNNTFAQVNITGKIEWSAYTLNSGSVPITFVKQHIINSKELSVVPNAEGVFTIQLPVTELAEEWQFIYGVQQATLYLTPKTELNMQFQNGNMRFTLQYKDGSAAIFNKFNANLLAEFDNTLNDYNLEVQTNTLNYATYNTLCQSQKVKERWLLENYVEQNKSLQNSKFMQWASTDITYRCANRQIQYFFNNPQSYNNDEYNEFLSLYLAYQQNPALFSYQYQLFLVNYLHLITLHNSNNRENANWQANSLLHAGAIHNVEARNMAITYILLSMPNKNIEDASVQKLLTQYFSICTDNNYKNMVSKTYNYTPTAYAPIQQPATSNTSNLQYVSDKSTPAPVSSYVPQSYSYTTTQITNNSNVGITVVPEGMQRIYSIADLQRELDKNRANHIYIPKPSETWTQGLYPVSVQKIENVADKSNSNNTSVDNTTNESEFWVTFEDGTRLPAETVGLKIKKNYTQPLDVTLPKSANLYDLSDSPLTDWKDVLKKYKNKTIYLTFWASYCPPCLHHLAYNNQTRSAFKDNDEVVFLFLNANDNNKEGVADWKHHIGIYKIGGEHYLLNEEMRSKMLKMLGNNYELLPRYMIINSKGNVVNDNALPISDFNVVFEIDNALKQK